MKKKENKINNFLLKITIVLKKENRQLHLNHVENLKSTVLKGYRIWIEKHFCLYYPPASEASIQVYCYQQTPVEVDKWSISFRTRNEKDNIESW